MKCNKCGKKLDACVYGNPECEVKRHWHCVGHGTGPVGIGVPDPCWKLHIGKDAEFELRDQKIKE